MLFANDVDSGLPAVNACLRLLCNPQCRSLASNSIDKSIDDRLQNVRHNITYYFPEVAHTRLSEKDQNSKIYQTNCRTVTSVTDFEAYDAQMQLQSEKGTENNATTNRTQTLRLAARSKTARKALV
eukprot:3101686-Amphidinium_carterae.1